MSDALVLVERDEPIAVVTLNRPDRMNALSEPLMEELVSALAELDRDESIRCIVLAGDDRAFAAGADIGEMATASAMDMLYARRVERWDAIRKLWTPLVAAVSGLLPRRRERAGDELRPDRRVRDGEVRPAGDEPRDHPGRGRDAAADARDRQGEGDGRDPLRAVPHRRGGRACRVSSRGSFAADAWLDEAKTVAREIASKGPVAQRLAKEAVNRAFDTTLDHGLEHERRLLYLAFASEDAHEGLTAFGEKRPPEFKGK